MSGRRTSCRGCRVCIREYVGHDNNRDAYMLNMIESRVLEHTWRQWEPQIIYVHHQSGPFPTRIWLPPFSEPVGIDAPFIMSREVNMIGMAIAKGLEERGQVGATHMGTAFDAWYPGYIDYAPNFKNIAAFWTETALYQYATPHDYTLAGLPAEHARPAPAEPLLEPVAGRVVAAARRRRLHGNRVAVGARVRVQIQGLAAAQSLPSGPRSDRARGEKGAATRTSFHSEQRDPVAAVELLRRLAFGGVRVYQLTADATLNGETRHPFTWQARGSSRPTRNSPPWCARSSTSSSIPDLRQYPGRARRSGPTTPPPGRFRMQMGVRVVPAGSTASRGDAAIDEARRRAAVTRKSNRRPTKRRWRTTSPPSTACRAPGSTPIPPRPPSCRLRAARRDRVRSCWSIRRRNNAFRAAESRVATRRHGRAPANRYAISGLGWRRAGCAGLRRSRCRRNARPRRTESAPMKKPRIGDLPTVDRQHWTKAGRAGCSSNTDSRSRLIHPEDFKTPLAEKIDVLILADDARVPVAGAPGRRGGSSAVRSEYSYQLAADDVQRLDQFVRGGGTLVCLSNASTFAIQQLKLPIKNVVAGLRPEELLSPRVDRRSGRST